MLALKLSRTGKKKQPSYRLVVVEKARDPWSPYKENLGIYNPKAQPKIIQLNAERIKYWLSVGAQPSNTVYNLLISQNIIQGKKRSVSRMSKRRAAELKEKADAAAKTAAA